MKKHLVSFFSGLGVAALIGFGARAFRNREQVARHGRKIVERGRTAAQRGQQFAQRFRRGPSLDLNICSSYQLLALGIENLLVDRIIENRPYRSKLELVSRVLLPHDVYSLLKDRVFIAEAAEPIKIAS